MAKIKVVHESGKFTDFQNSKVYSNTKKFVEAPDEFIARAKEKYGDKLGEWIEVDETPEK